MDAPLRFRIAPGRSRAAPSRVSALGEVQEDEEAATRPDEELVIAPLADAWRPPRNKNAVDFEADTKEEDDGVSDEPYGLQRKKEDGGDENKTRTDGNDWLGRKGIRREEDQDLPEPANLQVRLRRNTPCYAERNGRFESTDELWMDVQEYQDMPVEKFGEALLRGMGWEKGKPVGRNPKGSVEAREYVRRPERLGLGAKPKEIQPKPRRKGRLGEPDRSGKNMVMVDEHGNVKHTKTLDEKLVSREKLGLYAGKPVVILRGPHDGLHGKIVQIDRKRDPEVAKVMLELSGEAVEVNSQFLGNPSERSEMAPSSKKRTNEKSDTSMQQKLPRLESQHQESQGRRTRSWLFPNIRVRIIDKGYLGGRYYLKKGYVLDVITPTSCDILLDDSSRHLSDVDQSLLETVIPRTPGAPMQVVRGEHRGERGEFVSRDSSRGTVAMQLGVDYSVKTLSMDDVAEIQVHR